MNSIFSYSENEIIGMFNFQRSRDFLAIPITINIVLMISNSLLIWATVSKHKILIWPWLVLYAIEWLCLLTMMIYAIIVIPKSHLKVQKILTKSNVSLLSMSMSTLGDSVSCDLPIFGPFCLQLVCCQVFLQLPSRSQP